MGHKKKIDYEDTYSREFVKKAFSDLFNIKLKDGKKYKIDLISEENELIGVEVEHGHWVGDFWSNDQYSLLSQLEYQTINIPIRKKHYWDDDDNSKPNPSAKYNIFVRTNLDFSQFIIIRPETIRNTEKLHITKFIPNNNDTEEYWMSFKKEDVETYNLIDGKFILNE